ncbi:MAG: Holliday junction branch migration DNA helicase RuvB, partial [Armatimonadota bacterium]
MPRERIVSGEEQRDEEQVNLSLRPRTLAEYDVGQRELIDSLSVSIRAAKQRGEPLEHVLFDGPPGLGKTTLAHIIANEMEVGITTTSGPALERAADLIGILTNLEQGEVLFIDEAHRLPRVVEEFLYPAMEDFRVDFVVDRGPYAKTIKLPLKRFTIVGATTRVGLLTPPLRERFGIFHHLDFYTPEQLTRIITRAAGLLEIELTKGGAQEIARRARGTARVANRLLRRSRDFAQVKRDGRIDKATADAALRAMGVDEEGLDNLDRKYLATIIEYYGGGPVGIEAIAATLNEEVDTLSDVVEPYLLKRGFVTRTRQGRCATHRTYGHLDLTPPAEATQVAL